MSDRACIVRRAGEAWKAADGVSGGSPPLDQRSHLCPRPTLCARTDADSMLTFLTEYQVRSAAGWANGDPGAPRVKPRFRATARATVNGARVQWQFAGVAILGKTPSSGCCTWATRSVMPLVEGGPSPRVLSAELPAAPPDDQGIEWPAKASGPKGHPRSSSASYSRQAGQRAASASPSPPLSSFRRCSMSRRWRAASPFSSTPRSRSTGWGAAPPTPRTTASAGYP